VAGVEAGADGRAGTFEGPPNGGERPLRYNCPPAADIPHRDGIGLTTENPALQAILFDLMGVLLFLRGDRAAEAAVDAVDDRIGGVVDDAAFREQILRDFSIGAKEFERILSRIPEKYEPLPPLWDMLPSLRSRYKLGIINNGTRLTFPYFNAKLQLAERFDLILSSGAEGVRKPDPEIYRRAAARLGVEPRRCLFLDDSQDNVRGAREAGMQAVHWPDREEGLRRFVERLAREGGAG
jgi:HAD superfamily hydrolase (TIGR01509 family)